MPARQSFRKGVESALHARDHIGVQDFVLLEDFKSEDAFLENLRKRSKSDLIYVSAGRDACSLNSGSLAPQKEHMLCFDS